MPLRGALSVSYGKLFPTHSLRGCVGRHDLFEELAGPSRLALGLGQERLGRAGYFPRLVAQPARQPLDLAGVLGQLGDASVLNEPQPTLDATQEVVRIAQLGSRA